MEQCTGLVRTSRFKPYFVFRVGEGKAGWKREREGVNEGAQEG